MEKQRLFDVDLQVKNITVEKNIRNSSGLQTLQ